MGMHGAILRQGESWYTHLGRVFAALDGRQRQYNWLLTGVECNQDLPELAADPCWMTGEQLTRLVEDHPDLQWIWAVLSGFAPEIPLEQVLEWCSLPGVDTHSGYWELLPTAQHPLASIEIVPWDSSLVLFLAEDPQLVAAFRRGFPLSEDLSQYNLTRK